MLSPICGGALAFVHTVQIIIRAVDNARPANIHLFAHGTFAVAGRWGAPNLAVFTRVSDLAGAGWR